jgi:hypothetical protein
MSAQRATPPASTTGPRRASERSEPTRAILSHVSEASESRRGPSTLASDRGRGADISCAGPSGPSHQARHCATSCTVSKQPEAEQSGGKAPRADLPTDLTSHPMSAPPSEASTARLRSRLCPRSAPRPLQAPPARAERASAASPPAPFSPTYARRSERVSSRALHPVQESRPRSGHILRRTKRPQLSCAALRHQLHREQATRSRTVRWKGP